MGLAAASFSTPDVGLDVCGTVLVTAVALVAELLFAIGESGVADSLTLFWTSGTGSAKPNLAMIWSSRYANAMQTAASTREVNHGNQLRDF